MCGSEISGATGALNEPRKRINPLDSASMEPPAWVTRKMDGPGKRATLAKPTASASLLYSGRRGAVPGGPNIALVPT